MRKSNEYRAFAAHCLTFAKNSPNTADKMRLLTMAEAWLDLPPHPHFLPLLNARANKVLRLRATAFRPVGWGMCPTGTLGG